MRFTAKRFDTVAQGERRSRATLGTRNEYAPVTPKALHTSLWQMDV
jgi:hypothetical protein